MWEHRKMLSNQGGSMIETIGLLMLVFILIMAAGFQVNRDLWTRTFCNDDGTPSNARIILVFVVIMVASWTSVMIQATRAWPEIPSTWLNLIYALLVYAFGKKVVDGVVTVKGPTE